MKVTATYDDTLYQLVPKELLRQLKHFTICHLLVHPECGAPTEAEIDDLLSAAVTPPVQPAERKPLTEEQVQKLMDTHLTHNHSLSADFDMPVYACTIENVLDLLQAAHGIKGES